MRRRPRADAAQFLTKLGNPFEKIGADANGRASIDWGVYGVPETYVIDGAGRIAYKYIGQLTEQTIETELRPSGEIRARQSGAAPPRYGVPWRHMAQTIRASLLATATAATLCPRRCSSRRPHARSASGRRRCFALQSNERPP